MKKLEEVTPFVHEIIDGAQGPCKVYSGMATAIFTFNGIPIVIMAATSAALLDAVKEIAPNTSVKPAMFMPASIIHDAFIKRQDNEL